MGLPSDYEQDAAEEQNHNRMLAEGWHFCENCCEYWWYGANCPICCED